MSNSLTSEALLVFLLRLGGVLMLTAFGAMFLPAEWMAVTHRRLGLGEFPATPIVDYLTRSVSALYAVHGGLYLVVSTNVRRFRPIVFFLACANVVFGVALLIIDLVAGMPWYWTTLEGPPVVAVGILWLFLLRSLPRL